MLCSIELWLRFVWHARSLLIERRSPFTILDKDILGRQLFSGHVRPNGKIEVNAFVGVASNGFAISLDRWSKAPERLFKTLAHQAARRRSQSLKGFALFEAASLRSIRVKELPQICAVGAPTRRNPLHAEIFLPPDRERSFYLQVAAELRDKTKAKALLYK